MLPWAVSLYQNPRACIIALSLPGILIGCGWMFGQEDRKAASTLLRQDGKGGNYKGS